MHPRRNCHTDAHPSLPNLTGCIARESDYYSAHGGSSDIWMGTWHNGTDNRKVAIKVLRLNNESENGHEKMNKRLRKEILVWRMLDHPNIVPLIGITFDFGRNNPMGMVCPWLENGNLNGYIDRCGTALEIFDRFKILFEVAAGLSYLHSVDVVHGDLTGSNILIDGNGMALLTDFGLSNVTAGAFGSYITSSIGGSVRWAPPEQFGLSRDYRISTVTTQGDIYSYGSVILQTLSGKVPYHHLKSDGEVLLQLNQGVHPPRPPELADEHWTLIHRCWAEVPSTRPTVTEVAQSVQHYFRTSSVNMSVAIDFHPENHCQTLPYSTDSTQPNLVSHGIARHGKSVIALAVVCVCVLIFILHQVIALQK